MDRNVASLLRGHLFVSFHPGVVEECELTYPRYVAMHAMQEDGGSHGHEHGLNGYSEGNSINQRKQKGPQMRDTLATIGGMLLPLLTQFGHHH